MGILVEHAKRILAQAQELERRLDVHGSPYPTFEAGTSFTYPPELRQPEIFEARRKIVDDSKALHDLALGPVDTLQSLLGAERLHSFALRVIEHYDIACHVPVTGSITFEDLAAKLDVNRDVLQRILRFAFSMRVFQEKPLGSVAHTSISEALSLISPWSKMQLSDIYTASFQAWPQALRLYKEELGPRNLPLNIGLADGRGFFEIIASDPEGMTKFGQAMKSYSNVSGGSDRSCFIRGFDWESLGEGPLVDLGGGYGHVAVALAEEFPNLNIIVQDLPSNTNAANAQIPAHMQRRVTFQPQNFFEDQPVGLYPKAYLLKSVLHDWNDADCVRILSKIMPAVRRGTRIFIMDRLASTAVDGHVPSHYESRTQFMDLLMWSLFGAKERNEEDWTRLAKLVDPNLKVQAVKTFVGSDWGMVEMGYDDVRELQIESRI